MDGTYRISLKTPIGMQSGVISFVQDGNTFSGSIRTMGNISFFKNGVVNGDRFEFSGILRTGLLNLRYTAKGIVEAEKLKATANTQYGSFQIFGTKAVG